MKRLHVTLPLIVVLLLPAKVMSQARPALDQLIERAEAAGINTETVGTIVERARQRGATSRETATLIRSAVDLAEDGFPADPALDKALEGLAKGVPFTRIHPVIGELETHTREVGTFVRDWARQKEARAILGTQDGPVRERAARQVTAGAVHARMQGASSDVIRDFISELPANTSRRPIPAGELANALPVLADVPREASIPEHVAELVTHALDARLSEDQIRQIPTALRTAARQTGRPIGALARGAASAVTQGVPASEVLAGLFEGGEPGIRPPGDRPAGPPKNTPPGQDLPPDAGPPTSTPGGNDPGDQGPPHSGPPGGTPPDRGQPNGNIR